MKRILLISMTLLLAGSAYAGDASSQFRAALAAKKARIDAAIVGAEHPIANSADAKVVIAAVGDLRALYGDGNPEQIRALAKAAGRDVSADIKNAIAAGDRNIQAFHDDMVRRVQGVVQVERAVQDAFAQASAEVNHVAVMVHDEKSKSDLEQLQNELKRAYEVAKEKDADLAKAKASPDEADRKALDKLQGQYNALLADFNKVVADAKSMEAEISKLKVSIKDLQDEVARLRKQNDDLNKQIANLDAAYKAARNANNELLAKLSDIENKRKKLEKDFDDAVEAGKLKAKEAVKLGQDLAKAEAAAEQNKKDIEGITKAMDEAKAAFDKQMSQLKAESAAREKDLQKALEDLKSTDPKVQQQAQKKIDQLNAALAEAQEAAKKAQAQADAEQAKNAAIGAQLNKREADIEQLQKALDQAVAAAAAAAAKAPAAPAEEGAPAEEINLDKPSTIKVQQIPFAEISPLVEKIDSKITALKNAQALSYEAAIKLQPADIWTANDVVELRKLIKDQRTDELEAFAKAKLNAKELEVFMNFNLAQLNKKLEKPVEFRQELRSTVNRYLLEAQKPLIDGLIQKLAQLKGRLAKEKAPAVPTTPPPSPKMPTPPPPPAPAPAPIAPIAPPTPVAMPAVAGERKPYQSLSEGEKDTRLRNVLRHIRDAKANKNVEEQKKWEDELKSMGDLGIKLGLAQKNIKNTSYELDDNGNEI